MLKNATRGLLKAVTRDILKWASQPDLITKECLYPEVPVIEVSLTTFVLMI